MMPRSFLVLISFLTIQSSIAQKKPLDHSVYDDWQSIGQKLISNDGKWVVYTIDPQEGDNELVIQSSDAVYKKTVPRGYNALITEDSRFVVFRIKPFFKETREARIKKKKPDDLPKDSLATIELGKDSVWKKANVKGYKTPAKSFGWLAYQLEKPVDSKAGATGNKKLTDSLNKVIDSLKAIIESVPKRKLKNNDTVAAGDDLNDYMDADGDDTTPGNTETGTELRLRNLQTGEEKLFKNVVEYYLSKNGGKLLLEQSRDSKDSLSKILVLLYDLQKGFADTLSKGGNEFKNFAMTDDGLQVAYVAERDAKPKELEKFYKLWYYKEGMDSAGILTEKTSVGMQVGMTVSEYANLEFSKSGKRLFFGTAPIQAPKDTSLVEIDLVKLDVWHYNDDYLQSVQLNRLQQNLQQNFLAVYDFESRHIEQLASAEIPIVYQTSEGDADTFVGVTDVGKRIESQWTNMTKKDIYAINVKDGTKKLVKKDLSGVIAPSYISSTGKYIMWYDYKAKNYFAYDGDSTRNITGKIKVPLYNEENDSPTDPAPYGVMGWHEGDSAVYVYDKYDAWKIDPLNKVSATTITGGRKSNLIRRYILIDPEERIIKSNNEIFFRVFNDITKNAGIEKYDLSHPGDHVPYVFNEAVSLGTPIKAKNSEEIILTAESYSQSPDLYVRYPANPVVDETRNALRKTTLSSTNPQQKDFNWGSAELYKWKTFKGKSSEGILYKPEDFDPAKKYPLILYFYEKLSDGLNNYHPPSPTASRLNISFFVSRGYLVFAPDISYTIGHPAQSAYDYIVSAAKDLAKHRWVDAANIGIQGQSWGGIQVAQLITMTDMFKAAWAGAPVANMTSANVETMLTWQQTGGLITLSVLLPFYLQRFPVKHFFPGTTDLLWLLVLSWFCSVLAFQFSSNALKRLSAFTVNLTFNLEPIYGILLAFMVYKENKLLSKWFYIGFAIIVAALIIHVVLLARQQKMLVTRAANIS